MPKAKLSKSLNQPQANESKSIRGHTVQSAVNAQTKYEEQQDDEIEVLRSIFPEDFERIETTGAWSKKTEKSFRLKLLAESDSSLCVSMSVTFTATYPKTAPLLKLKFGENVPESTREKIQHISSTRPRDLVGEVMILEVSNDIRDILEDAAQALTNGRAVPSLEEERAKQEAEAEKLAQEEEERETKRLAAVQAEEEKAMQRMVDEELRRRDAARQKRQSQVVNGSLQHQFNPNDIVFDHYVETSLDDGGFVSFQAVAIVKTIVARSVTEVLEVRPVTASTPNQQRQLPHMILKCLSVSEKRARKPILDLEDDLERLKALSHENILNVFDFKLAHNGDVWRFDVLMELASGPSLHDILRIASTISVQSARAYSIDILQGLDYLHKHGIAHGSLDGSNVFICDSGSGKIAKLADATFQHKFHIISKSHDINPSTAASTTWRPWVCQDATENSTENSKTRKGDIWDFGVLLIKMIFGFDAIEKHQPHTFLSSGHLTAPFQDLLGDALRNDPRKRPNAFDLIPYEFLRTNIDAVQGNTDSTNVVLLNRRQSLSQRYSTDEGNASTASRYVNEWFELGRLGRGGYGEVVKTRNKLDGRVYAVKKITGKTQAQLSEVLSEVYLLATLNHPYVVRYYSAWPEDEKVEQKNDNGSSGTASNSTSDSVTEESYGSESQARFDFSQSAGGLDFISSTGYPKIEFDDSDDGDSDTNGDDDSIFERHDESLERKPVVDQAISEPKAKLRSTLKSTLYIQMEFCEKLTLRDIIRRGLHEDGDEGWRLFRQLVEGLAHIHGHNIIHRDLKPENVFIDLSNNAKIGDFGLATTGQTHIRYSHSGSTNVPNGDMTLSVGTALYVAPELKSDASGAYTDKVDMYSLGIIFFEMCWPLPTAMERGHVLSQLRLKDHSLPPSFQTPDKQAHGEIITSLIKHKPSERPSSAELLRGGKIPVQVEDEHIRQALSNLADPSSPYFSRMMETMFTQNTSNQLQDRLWDASKDALVSSGATDYVLLQGLVKEKMTTIFRRYGAVETSRQTIFPRSTYYASNDVAQFIDSSGTLVQLPYDLILPHARTIIRQADVSPRSFAFGTVFRMTPVGGAPGSNREADFDIVSYKSQDIALAEAEVIKCLDDLVREFPCFSKTPICFHISHSTLLKAILEFCRIPKSQYTATRDVLSKLHIGDWSWPKIRAELRSPNIGIASSSIDDLARFDFRDTPEKAFKRLQALLKEGSHSQILLTIFTHISGLVEYLKRFGVHKKVFFSPLSNFNEKFYRSHIMFQCLFDVKKRYILAAGGRYDSLVNDQRPLHNVSTSSPLPHAVGTNIAWDRIVTCMARHQKQAGNAFLKKAEALDDVNFWRPRRFDVLVASFDPTLLRSAGVKLVSELRAHEIGAELAIDARTTDQLLSHYSDEKHSWMIIMKHEGFSAGKSDLRVRSMDGKGETVDVQSSEIVSYMRSEIRERDQKEGSGNPIKLFRQPSHPESMSQVHKNDVHVLIAKHRSKKPNKTRIIKDAQDRVQDLLLRHAEGPVAAVETRDDFLQKLRDTTFADADSWRKVIQSVPLADRQYWHDLMDLVGNLKTQYGDTCRKCFIFNFRTGFCFDYDLGT